MKLAASEAIARGVGDDELAAGRIIPSVFDRRIVPAVAGGVAAAAGTLQSREASSRRSEA